MFRRVSNMRPKRSARKFSSISCFEIGKFLSVLHMREVPGRPEKSQLIPTQRDLNWDWIILSRSSADTLPLVRGIYCTGLWWFWDWFLFLAFCWLSCKKLVLKETTFYLLGWSRSLWIYQGCSWRVLWYAVCSPSLAMGTDLSNLLHVWFHRSLLRYHTFIQV